MAEQSVLGGKLQNAQRELKTSPRVDSTPSLETKVSWHLPLAFAYFLKRGIPTLWELLPESLVFRWLLQGFRVKAFYQDPGARGPLGF